MAKGLVTEGLESVNVSLTAGTDTLVGGAGNDIFNAPLVSVQDGNNISEFQTLTNGDLLDGGAGTNRLNAVLNAEEPNTGATTTPEGIENIQEFYIQSRTAANTLDMENVSGVKELWNDRSTRDLTVNNLSDADVTLGLKGVRADTDFNVTSTLDITSQDVVLQGAGRAVTAAGNDEVTLRVNSSTSSSITTLNLDVASGLNNIEVAGDLDNTALKNLNINGAGNLILSAAASFAGLEAVAAGNATGNLTLDISGVTQADANIVTGSGNDTVVMNGTLLVAANTDLVIDLGEGENTLGLTGLATDTELGNLDFTAGTIKGVDALTLANDGVTGITLAADASIDLKGTSTAGLTFAEGDAVELGANTLSFANTQESMALTFENTLDAAAAGTVDFGSKVKTAVINSEGVVGSTNAVTFTGSVLDALTLNAGANFVGVIEDSAASSLATLTLNDVSTAGDTVFTLELDTTASLTTIDLTGVTATYNEVTTAFVGGQVVIDADTSSAAFENAVTIKVGSAELDYTADSAVSGREVFTFTANDINNITLTNFEAGVGANRDRLDFSQFEGISSTEDLDIVGDGSGGTLITAADGQFNGTIELAGVLPDAALEASLVF